MPVKVGNEVIGAVGVGGAPGGHLDEQCAMVALDKIGLYPIVKYLELLFGAMLIFDVAVPLALVLLCAAAALLSRRARITGLTSSGR